MRRLWRTVVGTSLAAALVLVAHPAQAAAPLVIDAPPPSAFVGTVTVPYSYTFTATGGTAPYTFSVTNPALTLTKGLTLEPSGLLHGTPTALGTWIFDVVVTDASSATATLKVTMNVGVLPLTVGSTPPAQVTALINFTHQFTAAGGMPPYTFHETGVLPSGVIVQLSGLLVGTPHEVGTFNYSVRAKDFLTTESAPVPFTLTVVPPAISPAPPSPIYTGQDFSHVFTTTPGTIGSRAWSVPMGTIPPGLTLSSGGILSGKPAATGTFPFTLRATFTAGPFTVISELPITMEVKTPAAAFTSPPPPDGTVDTPYAFTFTADGDSAITFALLNGTLPPGLELLANGSLSGKPTAAGTYEFVVRASGAGSAADQAATVVIAPAPPPTTTGPPPTTTGPPPSTSGPAPTTNGSNSPGTGLPVTGPGGVWLVFVGVLLVAAGAAATFVARRRRTASER